MISIALVAREDRTRILVSKSMCIQGLFVFVSVLGYPEQFCRDPIGLIVPLHIHPNVERFMLFVNQGIFL